MLKVVYSNNMVQLAAQLAEMQQSHPLPPLETETVIVQSNELSRWLSLFLAQQHGIASYIDFPYPSAYIWSLFRQLLPNVPQNSDFSTDVMTWRVYELLPLCQSQSGFEAIDAYLGEYTDSLKLYGLAHRIADTFDQYLMYRPDWLQSWERGDTPHWQARLWQMLTAGNNKPMHRANLLLQLQEYLSSIEQRPALLPARITIFGISALPPVYMDLFALMAQHCDVTLFFLSPSVEYWGDLIDPKTKIQRSSCSPEQVDYLTSGHPLLSSLGKQGQEFFEQLQNYQPEEQSLFMPPDNDSLLGQLHADIYRLQNGENGQDKSPIVCEDDSIRVHACHSPMREIEILHDQLLDLFERHAELSPTDVVVMTPDIDLYTPWIDAVFGCAQHDHFIPYGIADSGIALQTPIITAFNNLLRLPPSRFDVETVMALLECSAIQHRFSLDNEQLELIRRWLRETHIHWGISANDKVELGLPEIEANTWRAGLDRLLMGYAIPLTNDGVDENLFDGKLGFDGISGDRAKTMAQLCAFIDKLDRYRQRLKRLLDTTQWQTLLLQLLDDFFLTSIDNNNEDMELQLIRKSIASLVDATELAQFKQSMSIELVTEWFSGHLDNTQTQSRFMGHGVTFCGMVPMRSIPFPVVCLIGMNDASYPRRQPTVGFDLLSDPKNFRKGDRSRRDDDRYLFLESLLSAQSHLYISYVGASISDNTSIPPSVLVSDLRDVLQQDFMSESGDELWSQLLTHHPLQAFSRRYFDKKDKRLFSYVNAHCPSDPTINEVESWFDTALPETDKSWRHISLTQLLNFFRHPGRFLMQQRLGLWLENNEQQLETREPFSLDGLQAWQLRQQLLDYRLQEKPLTDVMPLIQAIGVLPQSQVGEYVFTSEADKVEAFAERLLAEYPAEFLVPQVFDLDIDDFTITGQLDGLSAAGLFNYRMGKTKGNQVLSTWIRHLVLNCLKPEGIKCESRLITENSDYHFQVIAEAGVILRNLLNLYRQGLQQPIPLFGNTSFAFAKASLNSGKANPEKAMMNAWQGGEYQTGEMEDIYYQQLYSTPPLDDRFKELTLAVYQPLIDHLTGGEL